MSGSLLGFLSLAVFAIAIVEWFRRMNAVTLDGRRTLLFGACFVAIVLGVSALASEPGWIGGGMAVLGIAGGSIWLFLRALASQSDEPSNISIGSPLPAFSAPDHLGEVFDIESLRGHPVLIKLFRGHW